MMHSISTELAARQIETVDSDGGDRYDVYRAARTAEQHIVEKADDPLRAMKGVLLAALLGALLWGALIGVAIWLIG